jgi:diphthine synthase
MSAVIGLSGLQNYRFGRSVTVPFPEKGSLSETPYNVIAENKERNLHTLCFLDIRDEEAKYMTIKEALELLLTLERKKRRGVVALGSLAVGVARAGSGDVEVKADAVENLMSYDFGPPPHMLIFTARTLHFMEAEALTTLADAPKWVEEMVR